MTENAQKKDVTIGFRGTDTYRDFLQQAALDRGTKVQSMIESALDLYLRLTPPVKGAQPILEASNPFSDLPQAKQAKLQAYAEILRSGKNGTEVYCPDDLALAVAGLVKLMATPDDELDEDMRDLRRTMRQMLERRA